MSVSVLHITTNDFGGAGLAVLRLHKALRRENVESNVLVLNRKSDEIWVFAYSEKKENKVSSVFKAKLRSLRFRLHLGVEKYEKAAFKLRQQHPCFYTLPLSTYRVENHPLVANADIIHLHWIENFINYPTFFKKVNKPIVWTFHDINIGMGGFHFQLDKDKLMPYYQKVENDLYRIKKEALLKRSNLTIISLSTKMQEYTQSIGFLKDKPNFVIPNSVDTGLFHPYDHLSARKQLKLPLDKKIFLFISDYIHAESKGLQVIFSILSKHNQDNWCLCVVGDHPITTDIVGQSTVYYLGRINKEEQLSKIYSAVDLLVMPSYQEAFAQTPLESMACGTPVVTFPCSGTNDLIRDWNGLKTTTFTDYSLLIGIQEALSRTYNGAQIRNDIIERFAPHKIALKYVEVYNHILSEQ